MEQRSRFAVIDFETTGLKPRHGHRIIEVAIVELDCELSVTHEWETLVNPGRTFGIDPHRISPTMVEAAPPIEAVIPDILTRLDQKIVFAHNAAFERLFLEAELRRAKLLATGPIHCTADLAVSARLPRSLAGCCEVLGIAHGQPHRAVFDARATALLVRSLVTPRGLAQLRPWRLSVAASRVTGIRWTRENVEGLSLTE